MRHERESTSRPTSEKRRRTSRMVVLLAALVAMLPAVGLAACDGSDGADSGEKSVLRIGLARAPSSLDPAQDGTGSQNVMRALSNEAITHLKPDGSIGPALARSWRYVGEGNEAFEFTLREDARFSDGTPVTANAVKRWLEYFASQNGPTSSAVGPISSIETKGKWTVRINLEQPNPDMPEALSEHWNWGAVSSPKALENPKLLGTRTFGAGPYVLAAKGTVAGEQYTFVPNEYYRDKTEIRFSKVVVKIIDNPSSMLQAMKAGQLDVAEGDVGTAEAAQSAGLNVVHALTKFDGIFFMDLSGSLSKPLRDTRVRQALNYAIDRETITTALLGEYGAPTSEVVTKDGFDAEKSGDHYAHDPDKAKSLLADAGYPNGFTVKAMGQAFTGNIGAPMVQAVAKDLEEIGVDLKLSTAATFGEYFQKGVSGGEFPLLQVDVGTFPMWTFYSLFLKKKSLFNPTSWEDPQLEKLWLEGRTQRDSPAWKAMSDRITGEAYTLPVFRYSRIYYVGDGIAGVELGERGWEPFATDWYPE
jgi:peptide/nickel transport system substrate-binding protein